MSARLAGTRRPAHHFCLRRDFFTGARLALAADLWIAKSSRFLPALIWAAIHRGMAPRPAHVSERFFGLRYLGATLRPFILLTRGRPTAFLPEDTQFVAAGQDVDVWLLDESPS